MALVRKTKEEREAAAAAKYRVSTPLASSPQVGDIANTLAGIKQRASDRKSIKDKAYQEEEAKRVARSKVEKPTASGSKLQGLASFADRTKLT